jgi:hypothetical protein
MWQCAIAFMMSSTIFLARASIMMCQIEDVIGDAGIFHTVLRTRTALGCIDIQ